MQTVQKLALIEGLKLQVTSRLISLDFGIQTFDFRFPQLGNYYFCLFLNDDAMLSELHRYQEKLKRDLTLEGAKNLILISRKWRGRTGVISRLIPELQKSPVRAAGF